MSKDDVQKDISGLIVSAFQRDFWLNIQEELHTAYVAANALTMGSIAKLGEPEQNRFRPQARHYVLNAAFRRAAENSGIVCCDVDTTPKGESYIVVNSAGVKISRIGLNYDEKGIRGAKHRSLLAELNESFEGYTPDLFSERDKSEGGIGTLGMLVLNINPPHSHSQDSMLDLRIVVPFTNMKGYHFNRSVSELLELYHTEQAVVIPDKVIPLLKKRLKEQES